MTNPVRPEVPQSSPWWDKDRHQDKRHFLEARGKIKRAIRRWFEDQGFTEVETGQLQVSPGNETHLHGFKTERIYPDGSAETFYLHTSPEFAAKKLLAAGETKIFEFARVFRNREAGPLHASEFTMLEWYRAGADWTVVIEDTLALLAVAAQAAGTDTFSWRGARVPILSDELGQSVPAADNDEKSDGVTLDGHDPLGTLSDPAAMGNQDLTLERESSVIESDLRPRQDSTGQPFVLLETPWHPGVSPEPKKDETARVTLRANPRPIGRPTASESDSPMTLGGHRDFGSADASDIARDGFLVAQDHLKTAGGSVRSKVASAPSGNPSFPASQPDKQAQNVGVESYLNTSDLVFKNHSNTLIPNQKTPPSRLYYHSVTLCDAFSQLANIDLDGNLNMPASDRRNGLAEAAVKVGIDVRDHDTWSDIFSKVLVEKIEPVLGFDAPCILRDYPAEEAALARRSPNDPRLSERFELYVAGVELANGFGELTDPIEQRARFEADMDLKETLYAERYPLDEEFLEAISHMPTSSGVAMGFDRLVMLATGARRIDDVLWTPPV